MLKILLKVKHIIEKIIKSRWWFLISLWIISFTFGTLILMVGLPILFIPVAVVWLEEKEDEM